MTATFTPEWYCNLHHAIPFEMTTEPVENRIAYINREKPRHEIATRLTWLRKMEHPERLPAEFATAQQAYFTAGQAYDTAQQAYFTAQQAYFTARQAYFTARQAYFTARQAYDTARQAYKAYFTARQAYDTARRKHWPELVALHQEECPGCPYNYDIDNPGLIFPAADSTP